MLISPCGCIYRSSELPMSSWQETNYNNDAWFTGVKFCVVNAVLGSAPMADTHFNPPYWVFRVPENPSGSYITVHLQLHFFFFFLLYCAYSTLLPAVSRRWYGRLCSLRRPCWLHLTWPSVPLLETTTLLSEKARCRWCLMLVCCCY